MTQTQLDSSQYKPSGAATQVQFNGSGAMSANSNFTFDGTVLTVSQMKVTSIAAGFLPPVVTTAQKNAIVSPALGSIVYDSTLNFLQEWNGTAWVNVAPVTTPAGSNFQVQYNNSGAFGADGNLTWTGTVLDITGTLGTTAISTSGDIAGGNLNGITLSLSSAQTTLTGIAGTAICSQPEQGSSYKKVIIYLNGYTDTGTQTYTYPTAFINTPYMYGLAAGVSGASVSMTSVNFTVTTQTGFVFLEGY